MKKLTFALLLVYALLTAYTLVGGFFGVRYQPFFTPLLTLLAFLFALLHAGQRLGWGRSLLLLGLTFGVSLLFESVGVTTGLVYGPYHYTDLLGPKFLGLVPYLIPVAWFMMMYPAYLIGVRILPAARSPWAWRLGAAALGGLAMTAWDLAMDPMMVAGGHWVWEVQGAYFGIPLQNFWGWWLTTFTTFVLFLWLGRIAPTEQSPDPGFERLALASYAITGLSTVIVDLQRGLGGPALAGLLAMLPWVVSMYRSVPIYSTKLSSG
jgi:putative membrane protein